MQTPPDPRNKTLDLPSTEAIAASLPDQAARFVEELLSQSNERQAQRRHVDELGREIQRQVAYQSELLKTPMRTLAEQGEEGGPVAQALTGLRQRMHELDPQRHHLARRGIDRVLKFIPGMSTGLERYFQKYESAQQALDAIIHELESGKDRLGRDNLTLADDQHALEEAAEKLQEQVELGQLIDSAWCIRPKACRRKMPSAVLSRRSYCFRCANALSIFSSSWRLVSRVCWRWKCSFATTGN